MRILFLIGLIALSACQKKNGTGEMAPIPDVSVECLKTQLEACSQDTAVHARTVDIYWIEKTTCAEFNDKQKWVAHGSAQLTCNTTSCTANLKTWSDGSEVLTEIEEKTYNICAYIDTTDSDVSPFSNGEPRAEATRDLETNATALNLNDWKTLVQ